MDKHQLIQAILELSNQLERTPTKRQFYAQYRHSQQSTINEFGLYSKLIEAAGLTQNRFVRPKKLNNSIFERDIGVVLDDYEPRKIVERDDYKSVIVIGDTHFPFVSQRVLDLIYKRIETIKPAMVIQVGDLFDMYSHSKFPRSHNVYTPKDEERLAREGAEKMWAKVQEASPQSKCVQLMGNHDKRPLKRTLEHLPSIEHIVTKYFQELMLFKGVETVIDERQEFIFDDVQYIHGYKAGIGGHRDYALISTVCGHTHKGGVLYRRIRGQTLWELNAGLVGDPESKAMAYTPQKVFDATPGWGEIDSLGPRFVAV